MTRAGPDPVEDVLACADSVREALIATSCSDSDPWGGGFGRPRNAPARAADAHRRAWREGLGRLARALPRALAGDGVPRRRSVSSLAALVARLEAVRAHARDLGVPVPAAVEAARVCALDALDALEAGVGVLPPVGSASGEVLAGAAAVALARTRADRAGAPGTPLSLPVVARAGRARAPVTDAWSLRAFLAGGLVVGTHPFGGTTGRLVAWGGGGDGAAGLALGWDLDGVPLLVPADEPALAATGPVSVREARVDGRRARIDAAWTAGARRWARTVRTQQARLRVEDVAHGPPGPVLRRWRFGPGWALRRADDAWEAQRGGFVLRILLPSAWDWRPEDGPGGVGLVGHGRLAPGACVVASFELRRASGGGVAEGDVPLRPQ